MAKYLSERAFRFDNQQNPYLFRDMLLKPMAAKTVPFRAIAGGS
jgi:hypothetical protein